MILMAQGGASAGKAVLICPIQSSRMSSVRALLAGNDPIIPPLQAASTISSPETRNIGAAMAGKRRRSAIELGNPIFSRPVQAWGAKE